MSIVRHEVRGHRALQIMEVHCFRLQHDALVDLEAQPVIFYQAPK